MKLKLSFLFAFISIYSWSQSLTQTFNANGTFVVPAGVTSVSVQAWGAGGAGGGASGAGLLLGRAGAGGGGGAYASAPILVTPSTTLNVVVAGQTAGTNGASGIAGGNSTISGFETSILAAGGSGGAGNTAGGTPVGGNGGTIAASVGTTRIAGGNGGAGSSSLISLLLTSGVGGVGANGGGAGGASISSLVLGNTAGNTGIAPGGAGSGAINSANGNSQVGGNGGAGRVVLAYTCPVFGLTSIAASNICLDSSTTSTVSLTGSATSLPIGNYVVTYNRSNPSATGLTANLTVATAGTGSFSAVDFTNTGSSTITITKLTSASCISDINSNNTATITILSAPVGGTVTGGTTICSGETSGALTLSGNVGSIVKWQFAVSPFTTWTDVPNPYVSNPYTSLALTETTQFRAVVQQGSCGTANSSATTVTASPLPSIQLINTSISYCESNKTFETISIDFNTPSGTPTTYSIYWDRVPRNEFRDIEDKAFPSQGDPIKFDLYVRGTHPGTYKGDLVLKNASGCESERFTIFITVYDVPAGQSQQLQACSNAQYATPSTSINVEATSYSIDWDTLPDQASTSYNFLSNTTINNVVIPPSTATGVYAGVISFSNGQCEGKYPISLEVTGCGTLIQEFKSEENKVSVNNSNKVLNIDSSGRNINEVYIYDLSGSLIYKKGTVSNSKLTINNLKSNNQVLVVKVILDNNQVEVKKVLY